MFTGLFHESTNNFEIGLSKLSVKASITHDDRLEPGLLANCKWRWDVSPFSLFMSQTLCSTAVSELTTILPCKTRFYGCNAMARQMSWPETPITHDLPGSPLWLLIAFQLLILSIQPFKVCPRHTISGLWRSQTVRLGASLVSNQISSSTLGYDHPANHDKPQLVLTRPIEIQPSTISLITLRSVLVSKDPLRFIDLEWALFIHSIKIRWTSYTVLL